MGQAKISKATRSDGSERRVYIAQGEHAVLQGADAVISTLLGSCVAVCLWDPVIGVGGMNHFLLPDEGGFPSGMSGYGANAMELVVNGLIQHGAIRSRFRAKIFGGAEMVAGLSGIGKMNGAFATRYLERERIPCTSLSLGGTRARRVEFWPADGRARMKFLADTVPNTVTLPRFDDQSSIEMF